MDVTNCQDEIEDLDNDTNLISEPEPVIGIEELPDDDDDISVTETPKLILEESTSTDSELPDPQLQEPTSTGRGRPRKSDTPKKLDDVQQSDSERKTDFMLVTPSLKRGRGRPPNPFKLPKSDGPKKVGRPRIHPPKIPSGRGRGRPRIHPPHPQSEGRRFARPFNMTKSLEVRLVKCTVRESKKKGRPPGSKNKKKVKSMKNVIKRPRGRPPKSESSIKVTSKESNSQFISKESNSKFTSKESMSYQDFVKQVNEELSAINGTSMEDDIAENDDTTTEMEYSDDEREDEYFDDEWEDSIIFHERQQDESPSPKRRAGRPPGTKNKPKDEKLLSLKKKNLGCGSPKKEKRGRGRPPKSLQIPIEESPTVKKPGRPTGFGKNDENKTRLCKGDVSYTEAVEDIIEEISDSEYEYMSEEEEEQPVKRGRGRPPKQDFSYTEDVEDMEEQSDSEIEYISEEEEEKPVKKGRGRPRKIKDEVEDVQSIKRTPGRPLKSTYEKEAVHLVKKGPGRPPKNANEEYQVHAAKRGRGRPPKSPYAKQDVNYTEDVEDIIQEQSDSENEYMSEEEKEQPVKKGRGRPKKISNVNQDLQPLKRGPGRPPKNYHDDHYVQPLKRSPGRPPKSANSPGKRKRGRPSASESKKLRLSIPGVTIPRKKENKKKNEDLVIGRRFKTHINYAALAEGLDIEDKEDSISSEADTDNVNMIDESHSEYETGNGDMSNTHSEDSHLNLSSSGNEEEFPKIINEKRSPGRPKKTDIICTENTLNSDIMNFSEKRGRGRPKNSERKRPGRPKKIANFTSDDSQEESSVTEEVSKRGRGRPKKVTNSVDLTSGDGFEQSKQSPSKSNIIQHGVIKRGPGRPKKVAPTLDMTCDEEDGTGISGITMEGWEGFTGGIDQSKECPIDILCNGSLAREEEDVIAKNAPDLIESNIDSTDVSETNTNRQPVSYIDDVTIIDSDNLQLEPSPKPEDNLIQNKLENIAKQINSNTIECTKLSSNTDSLTQDMIIQPLTINSTSQLIAITDSQPVFNNNSAPQVVMINSTPHLLVNSTIQIPTSSSVPHIGIQESNSSSSSVVTGAVVPQDKVISETIAQSSELGQVSSLYLDVSIS